MNHQPFETWLLSEETLSPENTGALDAHLETCGHCRALKDSWAGVLDLFTDVPDLDPPSDFVSRWQERLVSEHQMDLSIRHRWQSMIMLILLGNIIAALVFLLGTQFLTTFETPTQVILSFVYRLATFVMVANGFQNLATTLIRTFTSIVPAGIWAILGLGLVGSGAIWIISMKSLSVLPRRT